MADQYPGAELIKVDVDVNEVRRPTDLA